MAKKLQDEYLEKIKKDPDEIYRLDGASDNKQCVIAALNKLEYGIEALYMYLSDEFKSDKDIILTAIKNKYGARIYKNAEIFHDDYDVTMKAVSFDGNNLQYASKRLCDNAEIVKTAITETGSALIYASGRYFNSKEYILLAAKTYGSIIENIPDELKYDDDIVKEASNTYSGVLKYASDALKSDESFVYKCVEKNGDMLEYADLSMRYNISIVVKALKTAPARFSTLPTEIKCNPDIIHSFLKMNSDNFKYLDEYAIYTVLNALKSFK